MSKSLIAKGTASERWSLFATATAPVREYLASTIGLVDLESHDEESLWAISERGEQMEMAGRLIAGIANRELCTRVHNISEELRSRGKPRRAFMYSIQVLEAFEALPDARCVRTLAQLGFTKFREILGWTPEMRAALAAGETVLDLSIEDATQMPSREFERAANRFKEQDDRLRQLSNDNTHAQTEISRLKRALAARSALRDESDLPEFAREARQEGLALSEEIGFAIESLEDVAQRTLLVDIKHPEANRWQPIAAGTVRHALAGVLARGVALLREIEARHGSSGTVPQAEQLLDDVELVQYQQAREHLLARHLTAAKKRGDERANTTPGKRGRKRTAGAR